MKRAFYFTAIVLGLLSGLFLFGPFIGQSVYRAITPRTVVESMKREVTALGAIFPPTAENESRRVELLRALAQRGLYPDDGIRDEAIEHHITPYAMFVRVCWRWKDFLGAWMP